MKHTPGCCWWIRDYPAGGWNRYNTPCEYQGFLTAPKGNTMSNFGIPWKSILAFIGVFGGQLWARAVVNGIPVLPETVSGWGALIGGSFIAAIGVYLKANVYTVPQAEANLAKATAGRHEKP